MATNVDLLRAEIARISRELETVKTKVERIQKNASSGAPRPFAKLRGLVKGADLTYDEIKAGEYTLREETLE